MNAEAYGELTPAQLYAAHRLSLHEQARWAKEIAAEELSGLLHYSTLVETVSQRSAGVALRLMGVPAIDADGTLQRCDYHQTTLYPKWEVTGDGLVTVRIQVFDRYHREAFRLQLLPGHSGDAPPFWWRLCSYEASLSWLDSAQVCVRVLLEAARLIDLLGYTLRPQDAGSPVMTFHTSRAWREMYAEAVYSALDEMSEELQALREAAKIACRHLA
jgi:hypothetical protein